jgi:glucose-6-phosphate 1-dehydrogenase
MEKNPLRFGLAVQEEPPPFSFVIFGVTGDLTKKKLLPALYSLFLKGFFSQFQVIGFARRPWTNDFFRETAGEALAPLAQSGGSERKKEFLSRLSYIQADFSDEAGYRKLEAALKANPLAVYYLATPPEYYEPIIERLKKTGAAGTQARIIIEKPFGDDLESARALNKKLLSIFEESQVFRIDHYLGKETVQNIMVLRFGNSIFEPIWNTRYIHHVEITMAETLGIENRGHYYEKAGAIRDIVQNHLLQLICLIAMEPPISLDAESVRNEKVKVLKSIRLIIGKHVESELVRGQYQAGFIGGGEACAYRDENGVAPNSLVETYAALRLFLDSWRWSGVPFFLRVGKRLSRRLTEITVQFKQPPLALFGGWTSAPKPNTLSWRIQPDEGMRFVFNSKIPGFNPLMSPVQMRFSYGSSFGEESPDAYERLILDVLHGDSTLFTRNDEIEAAWDFTTNLTQAVSRHAPEQIHFYRAGSAGPAAANALVAPFKAAWRRL